jgi:hypothetical protein
MNNYAAATPAERARLRELAKKQREIAELPVMKIRQKRWYDLNDGKALYPLVTFEFNGPPEEVYERSTSANPVIRNAENQLLMNIENHSLLDDDRVIPDYISIRPGNQMLRFGITLETYGALDKDGKKSMAYMYVHPIRDLKEDFHKLKSSVLTVDANLEDSKARACIIDDALGDILPARIQFPSFVFRFADIFVHLMGMENTYYALYDYPELMHKACAMLTADYLKFMREIEENKALLPNNDGSFLAQGSWGYTHSLPSREGIPGPVKFKDVWGYTESQETVGMAPEMFDEFFFQYILRLSEEFGLVSYGCCEPVHGIWDLCLSKMKNLRKLSISPWCDEEAIAERIRGRGIVYQRKPKANYIGVDRVFDAETLGAHIARTARAASGCPLEVTFRDVCTVLGDKSRMTKAIQIVRAQFDRYWKP